jgi:hypothetical protein
MSHASFSDGLLLNATPGSVEALTAHDNLLLTQALELSFLDEVLKKESSSLLHLNAKIPSGVEVEQLRK